MDNNIIKVQLASTAVLGMKIESKQKNTISHGDGSTFNQLLNVVSEQKVWDKTLSGNIAFPPVHGQEIKVWSESNYSTNNAKSLSSNALSFSTYINEASTRYGVPASIIQAVIQTESAFNPDATSSAGAKGLMQLMDKTARGLGVLDAYDPEQNINGGAKYLSSLLNKYSGDLKVALAAYNAGPTRVDRIGISSDEDFERLKSELPKETQNYVDKVLSYL